jgi:AbrB family looped-hinge helix DNA binding protein
MQTIVKTKVTQGGRIVIPAEMRKQLGIEIGEDVNLSLENDSVKISTQKIALRRIQEAVNLFGKFGDNDYSIVDELIAERRKEAEND